MKRHVLALLLTVIALPLCARHAIGENGSDVRAIATLKQTVSENRNDYRSWVTLGKAQAEQKMFDEAIDSLRMAVVLRTNLAEPHIEMARIYRSRNEPDKAVRELEMAQGLDMEPGVSTDGLDDLYAQLAAPQSPRPPASPPLNEGGHPKAGLNRSAKQQGSRPAIQPTLSSRRLMPWMPGAGHGAARMWMSISRPMRRISIRGRSIPHWQHGRITSAR